MGDVYSDVSELLTKGTVKQQLEKISMRIIEELEGIKREIQVLKSYH